MNILNRISDAIGSVHDADQESQAIIAFYGGSRGISQGRAAPAFGPRDRRRERARREISL